MPGRSAPRSATRQWPVERNGLAPLSRQKPLAIPPSGHQTTSRLWAWAAAGQSWPAEHKDSMGKWQEHPKLLAAISYRNLAQTNAEGDENARSSIRQIGWHARGTHSQTIAELRWQRCGSRHCPRCRSDSHLHQHPSRRWSEASRRSAAREAMNEEQFLEAEARRRGLSSVTELRMRMACDDDLMGALRADAQRSSPMSGSSSLLPPQGERAPLRGDGWQNPLPLEQPPGLSICDRLVDVQDFLDRRDLAARLGPPQPPKPVSPKPGEEEELEDEPPEPDEISELELPDDDDTS